LESESVVIFNLISDNIDIFNNLINETNNKVSSMTFNKFYVSVTRAKNSIIICEEGLGDHEQVKQILFYSGEKKIPEDIVESDIEEYLRTTNEPGKFFDQAIQLIEEKEYEKASRKNDTALRHLLNQFDTNDNLDKLKTEFKNSNLDEIQKLTSSISKENLEKYQHFFSNFVVDVEKDFWEIDEETKELLIERLDMLNDCIRIRNICEKRREFLENRTKWDDDYKIMLHEDFILLDSYDMTMTVLNDLVNDNKIDYINVARYIFGFTSSYKKIKQSLAKVDYYNGKVFIKVVNKELDNVLGQKTKNHINKLKEIFGG